MITLLRKIVSNVIVIISLCVIFLASSCKNSIDESANKSYSGEELYKGIFFAQGEVAEKLPILKTSVADIEYLNDSQDEIKNDIAVTQAMLINAISQNNPSYFSNFKTDIQSGNQVRIKEALVLGAVKFREGVSKMTGLNSVELSKLTNELIVKYGLIINGELSQSNIKKAIEQLQSSNNPNAKSRQPCVAVVVVVALALVVAAAVNIAGVLELAVAAVDVKVIVNAARTAGASELFTDQLSDQISSKLSFN